MARKGPRLTERKQRFVDAYMGSCLGNATQAAIAAGYSRNTAKSAGSRLLTFVDVKAALDRRRARIDRAAIATVAEAQEYFTETMRLETEKRADRTKAAELLVRTQGGFTEKHVIGGAGDLATLLGSKPLPEVSD
jgi:phage terminase small subunit